MQHGIATALLGAAMLSGCASQGGGGTAMNTASQAGLPDAIRVPAGHQVAMEAVGTGEVSYECRASRDRPGQFEWVFVGPNAALSTRGGQRVGRYYGPPATWESMDGSRVTGVQLAVAPAGEGDLPLQLVKANPAQGQGAMQGLTYIQRLATRGGVAPAAACSTDSAGQKAVVRYQADYVFWRAA